MVESALITLNMYVGFRVELERLTRGSIDFWGGQVFFGNWQEIYSVCRWDSMDDLVELAVDYSG